jgi:lipid-A-disaccharide synthase
MLTVFPFETALYEKEGIPTRFVGHPLLEEIGEPQPRDAFFKRYELDPALPVIALFPGSRKQEIERIFPAMLGAGRMLARSNKVQLVVGAASVLELEYLRSFLHGDLEVKIVQHATHDLMANADVAIVTSGTATLETGYFQTPMVVVYKTSWLTYAIGRTLVKIKNIGLVNIVAGETVVPELIQGDAVPERIAAVASNLLNDPERSREIRRRLGTIRERLGTVGASARVAETALAAIADKTATR